MTEVPTSSKEALPASNVLRVCFDASAGATLRAILTQSPSLFEEVEPGSAELILFGSDEIAYLRGNALHRQFPDKSFCITESDIPTFRLPGLYAANSKSWIAHSRTRTMNYVIAQIERPNLEVRRHIGQVTAKRYLYSFMGGTNSWTRRRLFQSVPSRPDTLIQATDSYNHWQADHSPETKGMQRERFAEVMAASRYVLCPRGCGVSSYRIFESMSLGIAPVIIADDWKPVEGVDWSFALFVPERHLPDIDRIVREREGEWEERGRRAKDTYEAFFSPEAVPQLLHDQLADLRLTHRPEGERVMAMVTETRAAARQAYWDAYKVIKRVALRGFQITKVPVPIPMNRSLEEQLKSSRQA